MRASADPSGQSPMRRLAILGLVFVAAILSCGKDVTGPVGSAARFVRGLSFDPVFPPAFLAAGGASSGLVQFSKVHVVLHHSDGTVALDTTIDFPAGADSLTLNLTVKLLNDAPATGEPMTLNLGYLNAAGDTVFKGGPVSVTASPPPAGGGSNPPVHVPVSYTGPGSSAVSVAISPRSGTVVAGAGFSFTAIAKDNNGVTLGGTPIIWNSLDPSIATITSAAAGNGLAQDQRGSARIIAQLLTGPADTVRLFVVLPASNIVAQSGNGQFGVVGTNLALPLVVKVAASDGVGVAGTRVNFAVATGGGSVGTASMISDASGLAQTTFKLGTGTGAQTVTATAAGLNNSPVIFIDTAIAATASKLVVTTQPVNGVAGTPLTPIVVTAEDNNGNIATTFSGPVTVAFGANAAAATLGGTNTVNAVAGVATFTALTINKNGTAYTLVASSTGLTSATTSAFDIAVGPAASLALLSGGAQSGTVGSVLPLPVVIKVADLGGNAVAGKTVAFATANGSLSPASGASDAQGLVSTTWTLGGTTGAQTMTATSAGLTGSPLTIGATATSIVAGPAASLVFSTGPTSAVDGVANAPAIVVQAKDAGNLLATTFVGNVTLTIGTNPGGSTLGGTVTVAAVAGVATFPNITLSKPGIGYTLTASSGALTPVTSAPFNITAGAATHLIYSAPPVNSVAGVAIAPSIVVQANDAGNFIDLTFNGNVTLTIGTNPGASTLGGTVTVAAVNGIANFSTVSLNHSGVGYTLVASSGALTPVTSAGFAITAAAATTMAITGGNGQGALVSTLLPTPLSVTLTDALGNLKPGVIVNWAVATGGGSLSAPTSVTSALGVATINWTLGATPGVQTATATAAGLAGSPATFTATGALALANKTWVTTGTSAWTTATNWSPAGVPAATDSVFIPTGGTQPSIGAPVTLKSLNVATGATLTNTSIITISGNLDAGNTIAGGTVALVGTGTLKGTINGAVGVSGTYTLAGATTIGGSLGLSAGQLTINGQTLTITGTFATTGTGMLAMTNAADVMSVTGNVSFGGGVLTGFLTNGTLTVGGNFAQAGGAGTFAGSNSHVTFFNGATQTISYLDASGNSKFGILKLNSSVATSALTDVMADSAVMLSTAANFAAVGVTLRINRGLTDPNGHWTGATTEFLGPTPTLPANVSGNVIFKGNPAALQSNTTVGGVLTIDLGNLSINGHTLNASSSFITQNGGRLTMNNAADALNVVGGASFGGGSEAGLLTNGQLGLMGNFTQISVSGGQEFAATNGHTTVLSGTGLQNISMATPDTLQGAGCTLSCFGNLTVNKAGGTLVFGSSVHASGNLLVNAVTSMNAIGAPAAPRVVAVKGNVSTAAGATVHISRLATKGNIALGALTMIDTIAFHGSGTQLIPAGTYHQLFIRGTPTVGGNMTVTSDLVVDSLGMFIVGGNTIGVGSNLRTVNGGTLVMTNASDVITVGGSGYFQGGTSTLNNGSIQISADFAQGTTGASYNAGPSHVTRFNGAPTISFANPTTSGFGRLEIATAASPAFTSSVGTSGDVWVKTGPAYPVTNGAFAFTIGGSLYDSTGGRWQATNTTMSGISPNLPKSLTTNLVFSNTASLADSVTVTGPVSVSGASAELELNNHFMSVSGTFTTSVGGRLKMTHPNDTLIVAGSAAFNGGSTVGKLTAGYLELRGPSFVQGGAPNSFEADDPHTTFFTGSGPQTITFGTPNFGTGGSHFGTLYLADTATNLGSSINVQGKLETGIAPVHLVHGAAGLVTSGGADVRHLTFDGPRWALIDGMPVITMDFVTFQNMDPTVSQMTVQRNGAGVMPNFNNWIFSTVPTSGSYLQAFDTDGATNGLLNINFVSPTPAVNGGFVGTGGGATITGWPNLATWTANALSPIWSTPGNWSPNIVPTATTDVVIAASPYQPQTGAAVTVRSLKVNSGTTLSVTVGNLTVTGDITVQPTGRIDLPTSNVGVIASGNVITDTLGTTGVTTCAGPSSASLNLQAGTHNITGKFCNLANFGTYAASGPIQVVGSGSTGGLNIGTGGSLNLNGKRVDVVGFTTSGTGTITMQNPADTLLLHGGGTGLATFGGGSETGLMTAGTIVDRSAFLSATGLGFDATGSQTLVVDTTFFQTLSWTAPVAGHGLNNVFFKHSFSRGFSGNINIAKDVTIDFTDTLGTIQGAYTISVGGNIIDNSPSQNLWTVGTTVLTGTPTILPYSIPVNTIVFNNGGGTISLPHDISTNYVTVDGGTTLKLNGHFLKLNSNYFTTQNGGILNMTTVGDSLEANRLFFNGGSTSGLLTNGGIYVTGAAYGILYQGYDGAHTPVAGTSSTAFAATGTRAWFNPSFGQNVAFLNPGTGAGGSHFGAVQTKSGGALTVTALSDVFVDSVLTGEQVSGVTWASDSAVQGIVRTITTKGIYNSGTNPMTLQGMKVVLNDGPAASTFFNSVTWSNFPASYTGTLLTINRSSTAPQINFNNFSAVTLGAGGEYINNIGAIGVTLGLGNVGGCILASLGVGGHCP